MEMVVKNDVHTTFLNSIRPPASVGAKGRKKAGSGRAEGRTFLRMGFKGSGLGHKAEMYASNGSNIEVLDDE